jgi:hypothetical protein
MTNPIERLEGKYWYKDDELHRLDGPAIEFANGTKAWFIDGKKVPPFDSIIVK